MLLKYTACLKQKQILRNDGFVIDNFYDKGFDGFVFTTWAVLYFTLRYCHVVQPCYFFVLKEPMLLNCMFVTPKKKTTLVKNLTRLKYNIFKIIVF